MTLAQGIRGQDPSRVVDRAALETIIARFEADCWHAEESWPELEAYLTGEGAVRQALLVELAHADLELRRERGRPMRLHVLFSRYPELVEDVEALRSLEARAGEFSTQVISSERDSPWSSPPLPERVGRFELLELVGAGGCGLVYRARDPRLNRIVALKLPRREWIGTSAEADRFVREARTAASLRHPGIVSVYEAGQADGRTYLACEFIEGSTLARRLGGRPLSPGPAAEIVAQMAEALDFAHRQGVIHRDIKPTNILMDQEGRPHLADFGLAKSLTEEQTLTDDGQTLGTPAYMSPEQARGEMRQVGPRSDIYSLGVVLFEALTGERPFRGHPRSILLQVQNEDPKSPRRLNPHVPLDLEAICLTAMAHSPSERYATAGHFAEDLKRYLRGETVRARPAGQLRRICRAARRRPLVAGLLLALVAIGALGFGGVAWQWSRSQALYEAEHQQNERLNAALSSANSLISALATRLARVYPPGSPDSPLSSEGEIRTFVGNYRNYLGAIHDEPRSNIHYPSAQMNLARIYEIAGHDHEAERAWITAIDICRAQLMEDPIRVGPVKNLNQALSGLAVLSMRRGQFARACSLLDEVINRRFRPDHPALAQQRVIAEERLAKALYKVAERHFNQSDFGTALPVFQRCRSLRAELNRRDPGPRALLALWQVQVQIGRSLDRLNRFPEAHAAFTEARALVLELLAIEPNDSRHKLGLAMCEHVLGNLWEDLGQPDEAIAALRRAEAIRIDLIQEDPDNLTLLSDLEGTRRRIREITAEIDSHANRETWTNLGLIAGEASSGALAEAMSSRANLPMGLIEE